MSHGDFTKELNALREKLPVVVEETTPKQAGPKAPSKTVPAVYYSPETAGRIVDLYTQGKSLYRIAREESEMPAYGTLLRWAKEHPDFSKMLRSVRVARAVHFEDAAIDAAEAAEGKDADRLKVETYKWAAEVNDPATYGKKVAVSGDGKGAPIQIQVITGFGPPNEWQSAPKLNADGTIDRSAPAAVPDSEKDVTSETEVATDADARKPADPTNAPARHPHDAGSGQPGGVDGADAL